MQHILEKLEDLRDYRSFGEIAAAAGLSRWTTHALHRGTGYLSALHKLANYYEHALTIEAEGFDKIGLDTGPQLRALRLSQRRTVHEVAALCGSTDNTIARIETGADTHIGVIARYAEALGTRLVLVPLEVLEVRVARCEYYDWIEHGRVPTDVMPGRMMDSITAHLRGRVDQLELQISR